MNIQAQKSGDSPDFDREKERVAFISLHEATIKSHRVLLAQQEFELKYQYQQTLDAIDRLRKKVPTRKIRKLIGGFQRREKQQRGEMRRIAHALEVQAEAYERTSALYDDMLAVPRVRAIYVSPREPVSLIVQTEVLFGKHERTGAWYRFAPLRVRILLPQTSEAQKNGEVRVVYSGECVRGNTSLAPQVSHNSNPCLGQEAAALLKRAVIEHDYLTMINVVVRFAECFGHQSPDGWPKVKTEDVPEWYIRQFGR